MYPDIVKCPLAGQNHPQLRTIALHPFDWNEKYWLCYWWRREASGTLWYTAGSNLKMIQPLWKTVWQFLASPVAQRVKNHLQCRRPGFDSWVGKIPWRREWQHTSVFLPGESHRQRTLGGYSPWGCKESDTIEQLTHARAYYMRWPLHSKWRKFIHTFIQGYFRSLRNILSYLGEKLFISQVFSLLTYSFLTKIILLTRIILLLSEPKLLQWASTDVDS